MVISKLKTLSAITLVALSLLLVGAGPGFGMDRESVFEWTLGQMGIRAFVPPPPIFFVDQQTLASVFVQGNRRAYLRWENQFGEDKARMILKDYLDDILGLFDYRTGIVYVGSFLDPCRQRAILAHELTHYLQHTLRGPIIDLGDGGAAITHWAREREAQEVEKAYLKAFCGVRMKAAMGSQ
ncbi:MAG: hypothetical protein KFF50_06645 [Desulfatitalea sp.]|nr:hypothetical protein [Desulfatitalea sp.]